MQAEQQSRKRQWAAAGRIGLPTSGTPLHGRWLAVLILAASGVGVGCGSGDPPADASIVTLLDNQVIAFSDVSDEITFDVPDNALSVTVTAAGDPLYVYFVDEWTQPDGSVLVNPGWYGVESKSYCLSCANRVAVWIGAATAMAPGNPAVTLSPGRHRLRLGARRLADDLPGATRVKVAVLAKTGVEVPTTGVLDLDLFLTGAGGVSAPTAANDAALQSYLQFVDQALAKADIRLGDISYHDIDAEFATIEDLQTDLPAMFAAASGGSPSSANVYLVASLPWNRGLSPIPGPGPVDGAQTGGATVALEIDKSPGLILAHELGHYLGLFHTKDTFVANDVPDQLSDTPDDDPTYLMHPDAADVVLSPEQGRQMRLSLWVR